MLAKIWQVEDIKDNKREVDRIMVEINNMASQICTDNRVIHKEGNNMATKVVMEVDMVNTVILNSNNRVVDTIRMNKKTLTMMTTKISKKSNGYATQEMISFSYHCLVVISFCDVC